LNILAFVKFPAMLLWNICNQLPTCTVQHHRRAKISNITLFLTARVHYRLYLCLTCLRTWR